MNKKIYGLVIVVFIVCLVVVALFFGLNKEEKSSPSESQGSTSSNVNVPSVKKTLPAKASEGDYTNFVEVIKTNDLIQKLPEDSKIILSFYNFATGERTWEKSYALTRGNVEENDDESYDIKLIMHSKYLSQLKENNLCQVIQESQRNGDFGSETSLSKTELFWKFKGLLEYRDCFGI